jgi:hypothetical protein
MKMISVGQEDQDPADAAGRAAYDEAQNASWPPEKSDAESIGAAAGGAAAAAACTAYGAGAAAPLCAAIGSEVGEFVGGVFYDLADSWFGTSDLTRRHLDALHRQEGIEKATVAAGARLAELHLDAVLPFDRSTTTSDRNWPFTSANDAAVAWEIRAMRERYGLKQGRGFTWDLQTDQQLQAQLKRLAAAESGRGAELIAIKNELHPPSGSAGSGLVLGAVGIGGVLWLLAKLL